MPLLNWNKIDQSDLKTSLRIWATNGVSIASSQFKQTKIYQCVSQNMFKNLTNVFPQYKKTVPKEYTMQNIFLPVNINIICITSWNQTNGIFQIMSYASDPWVIAEKLI